MSEYIHLKEQPQTGKTKKFWVLTKDQQTLLGEIKWYPGWRRYCFFPEAKTLYDSKCLKEITSVIDKLMEDRKNEV